MRSRTVVVILVIAAIFLATTPAVVPVVFEVVALTSDAPPTRYARVDVGAVRTVALADDVRFRGPPAS